MSQQISSINETLEPITHHLAAILKAAGDSLRVEVLQLLAQDSFGVLELSRIFGSKQSGMSHHLKVLAKAGLVATRREGNSIYYRRSLPDPEEPQFHLVYALFKTLDETPIAASVRSGLADIQRERAEASQQFFAQNADQFREHQDLIAAYSVYGDAVAEMLTKASPMGRKVALEIGPGEGEFLGVLSKAFEQVYAIDNSELMLERSAKLVRKQGLPNIQLIHGELSSCGAQLPKADCVVINMVLHHVPSPADMFVQAGSLLQPGGSLFIADLCRHQQQWAKDACGDQWLGFDPEDFSRWSKRANLEEGQSQYIALRNGFQIQIRQFYKLITQPSVTADTKGEE